ncbi:MAG: hypothetical protein AB1413_12920 [Thermodesulfobacteriota bacterium]
MIASIFFICFLLSFRDENMGALYAVRGVLEGLNNKSRATCFAADAFVWYLFDFSGNKKRVARGGGGVSRQKLYFFVLFGNLPDVNSYQNVLFAVA